MRALVAVLDEPACAGEVYNVGRPESVTIGDLARRVNDAAGRDGSDTGVVFRDYASVYGPDFEDPRDRLPDIGKLHAATGWSPTIPLTQTIRELVDLERQARPASQVHQADGGTRGTYAGAEPR